MAMYCCYNLHAQYDEETFVLIVDECKKVKNLLLLN